MSSSASLLSTVAPLQPIAEMSLALFVAAYAMHYLMHYYRAQRALSHGQQHALTALGDFLFVPKPLESAAGDDDDEHPSKRHTSAAKSKPSKKQPTLWSILFSFVGLQGSYLVWGVMQERLMTTTYGDEHFPSSSMLVLSNRLFAIVFALIAVNIIPQPVHRAPFVDYSFAAVANSVSSMAQYEALRYVSFPVATVSKACKIIPTMLMGRLVQGKTYPLSEYFYAGIITLGVGIFALESAGGVTEAVSASTTKSLDMATFLPGALLLCAYLVVDAFTSNWQNRLYQEYQVSPFQCMLGVNVFSTAMGVFNLLQSRTLTSSLAFLSRHPAALADVMVMSLSSAIGQLFIYYTIDSNGPVIFAVITVTRQLFSIALSSLTFGHVISNLAWFGVVVTFGGILGNQLFGKRAR